MSQLPRGVIVIVVLVVAVPLLFTAFFERVMPYHIGVKQWRVGGAGVVEQDYQPGFRVGVVGVHKWYFLPRATHFLHYVSSESVTNADVTSDITRWEPPLEIRTKDNNETIIEVSVPYKIKDGEAHEIVMKGLRQRYQDRVETTVQGVLRAQLAELSSEELQETETRLGRARATIEPLNAKLAEFHVEALAILIRRVSFQPEYEARLQDKQYLTQKANLDRAQSLVANEAKVTNSIEKQIGAAEAKLTADWDKRFQEERSRYEVLIEEIRAKARVYESRTKAEGDRRLVELQAEGQLELDRARALRDELRNEALGSRGGRIYLALQAAGNLAVPSVTLNSNDPRVPLVLDLDEMTGVLLGDEDGSP